jgi:hypothetical protein
MLRSKFAMVLATAATAVAGLQSNPVHAAGPLLFAPWALGHLLGAAARAAAAPLVVGAAAASASYGAPAAGYPQGRGYYYGPGSYGPGYAASPPAYYPQAYPPPAYYAPAASYYRPAAPYYAPPGNAGSAGYYGRPVTRWYQAPRGYYAAPRMRYSGLYGAQVRYRAAGLYRRR